MEPITNNPSKGEKPVRSYFSATLACKCPRCRQGNLFQYPVNWLYKNNLTMHKNCPVCGQPTEMEVGFYFGTGYVSYAITIAFTITSFILWLILIGISSTDNRIWYWLVINAFILLLIQPWLMRVSRSLWLSWFVKYNPFWRTEKPDDVSERLNNEQSNNW